MEISYDPIEIALGTSYPTSQITRTPTLIQNGSPTSIPSGATFILSDSSLPNNLSLNSTTGVISGTFNGVQTNEFGFYQIALQNGNQDIGFGFIQITIEQAQTGPTGPSNLTYSSNNVVVYNNTQGTINVTSVNGGGTFSYSATYNGSATIPTGISLDINTGTITYAILDANVGYYSITITATNEAGSTTATVIINRGFVVNNLKYSFIDNTSTDLKVDGFNNTDSYNPDLVIPADVTYNSISYDVTTISSYAFPDKTFNNVNINEGITTIKNTSFITTSINGTLNLPLSLTNVMENAFYISTIKIIDYKSILSLSSQFISSCNIDTIYFGSSVEELNTYGIFDSLYSLKKIVFRAGSNITSIDNNFITIQNIQFLTNVDLIMIQNNNNYWYKLDKDWSTAGTVTSDIINFNNIDQNINYLNTTKWLGPPVFSYTDSPYTLTQNASYSYANTPIVPTASVESSIINYSLINPLSNSPTIVTLPTGLLFDGKTGKIYGTPTAITSQTSYTIYAINNADVSSTTIQITITAPQSLPPTNLNYGDLVNGVSEKIITINVPITVDSILPTYTNNGKPITSYSISPAITTSGQYLQFNNTTGEISGLSSVEVSRILYTITGNYNGGTIESLPVALTFTKNPTNLTYGKSYIFNLGDSVSIPSPTYDFSQYIEITSYYISPDINTVAGLTFNTTTGAITGTCTGRVDVVDYFTVGGYYKDVTNTTRTLTTPLDLRIKNIAPSNLTYSQNGTTKTNYVVYFNKTLSESNNNNIIPSITADVTFDITNSIPDATNSSLLNLDNGLRINKQNGKIDGVPNVNNISKDYTITAINNLGSINTTITISVVDEPPQSFQYNTENNLIINNQVSIDRINSNVGIGARSYSINPIDLPIGLSFDITNGVISGTPTTITNRTQYTVTAINSGGTSSTTLYITVNNVAPNISVSSTPYIYTKGTVIQSLNVSNSGGLIESFTITEVGSVSQTKSLPSGLTANLANGIITISGTPDQTSGFGQEISYQINAINIVGTSSATIKIIVNDIAPTISYSSNPYIVTRASTINPISPTVSVNGGTPTSYSISSVSPGIPLPAGLSFNTITGIISGTVTSTSYGTFTYDIMATNTGGNSTPVRISITVNDIGINFGYNLPTTFIVGVTSTTYSPINNNSGNQSPATSFSASINKPSWISINTTTGLLTFSPSSANFGQSSSEFTIIGTNSTTGATSYTYTVPVITVVDKAPDFTYGDVTIVLGTTYANSTSTNNFKPSLTGNSGTITSYSIGSTLPTGLSFNTTTGIIYGILNTISSLNLTGTSYTISSTNSGGTKIVTFRLKVIDKTPDFTMTGLVSLSSNLVVGTTYTFPAANVDNTIGVATNFSISPSINGSISINSTSGAVTIAPIQSQAGSSITLTITGTNNNDPTSSKQITKTVNIVDKVPNFSYGNTTLYRLPNNNNSSSHTINPTINANSGVITNFSTSSLPAGLVLNANGSITGRPTTIGSSSYTITGTNSGGSLSPSLTISIADEAPTNLRYNNTQELTLYVGTLYNIIPTTDTGYVDTYQLVSTFSSDLGLSFTNDGRITGTPKKILTRTPFTISLANNATTGPNHARFTIYITLLERPSPPRPIQYFMRSAFSNNLLGYYKKGSTKGSIGGTVTNSRAVRRRT